MCGSALFLFFISFLACHQCTGGKYCPHYNATSPEGLCAAGYYCESGSNTDRPESNHTGIAGPCTNGHYCPVFTTSPVPCPRGRYGNGTHLKKADDCELCEPGYYCDKEGLVNVSGPCAPGFYCLEGSEFEKPPYRTSTGGPCTIGHYCEIGTSYPMPCNEGFYNSRTGQSQCEKCCSGYYCPNGSISCSLECPSGHYCPEGTTHHDSYPCPPGTYNNGSKQSNLSGCQPCDPGMYCPTSGASEPYEHCDAGWYCTGGAWSPQPPHIGNITGDTCTCLNFTTGGQCQPGEFCPKGSSKPTPCTAGEIIEISNLRCILGSVVVLSIIWTQSI